MDDDFSNKRSTSVDELNELLYHQKEDYQERPRRKIHDKNTHLPTDFPGTEIEQKKVDRNTLPTSFFKKMFFGVLGFFVVTLIAVASSMLTNNDAASKERISMEIINPPFVDGGETLEIHVRIQNFNVQALELPDLILTYPKDSRNANETVVMRRSLETINQGDRVDEQFTIILFGQEGEVRPLQAKLEYRINGSNAIFIKETSQDVIIRSTPATVSFHAPSEIVRGQELEFSIDVASNSNSVVSNTLLDLEYPRGFEFVSAEPAPDFLDHVWNISSLSDEKKTITIRGYLSALEGQGQTIVANFGKRNSERQNEIETLFNRVSHTVEVMQPFIKTELKLNGKSDASVPIRGKQEVEGEITYMNTLGEPIQDAQIVVNLSGSLYNPVGVRSQGGFFSSSLGTITWDKTTLAELKLLEPGVEKTLSFTLPTQELVGRGGSIEKPELDIRIDVSGIVANGVSRKASDVSRATVIANSDMELTASIDHEGGLFEDTGPMPPIVGETTTYTVTFQVTNTSNEVHDVKAEWHLPSYVTWIDTISPSIERSAVSYDELNRKVVWNLKNLRSGLGVNQSLPRTLSFQVSITPSLSQIDDQVALTSDILMTGTDAWTKTKLSYKKTPIENRIQNSQEPGADGRITQ